MTRIAVGRTDFSAVEVLDEAPVPLDDGQVRLAVDVFGLSANNISYALAGDFLGYWSHFPVSDSLGCIPVWGFADVVESRHDDIAVGERVFGYLPMASETVVQPAAVDDLAFHDAIAHRSALHPWYTRMYRCAADPVYDAGAEGMIATLWALFMTGWALAAELSATARTVVVSSASSKTSLSMAWAMQQLDAEVDVVGLTSAGNVGFVEASGVYDTILTYDDLSLADVTGPAAYVDIAGNASVKQAVHDALGDRLTDSVLVGGTHKGAGAASGELSGPAPRFFFIPDVAEQHEGGHPAFHADFASAWARFLPWIDGRLVLDTAAGLDAIVATYRRVLGDNPRPNESTVLSW